MSCGWTLTSSSCAIRRRPSTEPPKAMMWSSATTTRPTASATASSSSARALVRTSGYSISCAGCTTTHTSTISGRSVPSSTTPNASLRNLASCRRCPAGTPSTWTTSSSTGTPGRVDTRSCSWCTLWMAAPSVSTAGRRGTPPSQRPSGEVQSSARDPCSKRCRAPGPLGPSCRPWRPSTDRGVPRAPARRTCGPQTRSSVG
mmetsp:Transcript_25564/g.76243  ORF Transcript_25564/g.76243 Transcript_25564/m.76243 type:complete len:202 (-) Transcript_25564:213-818(-)